MPTSGNRRRFRVSWTRKMLTVDGGGLHMGTERELRPRKGIFASNINKAEKPGPGCAFPGAWWVL